MTVEMWDPDQAVTRGPLDDALEGRCADARYGVTEWEEIAGEPLSVALAQEEADPTGSDGNDDQWALVENEWDLIERVRTDDDGMVAPEESAMHVVQI